MSLNSILTSAIDKYVDITKDIWYLAAISVLASANRPEDVDKIVKVVSEQVDQKYENQALKDKAFAKIILRMREAALKSHIIIGFPKAINALQSLYHETPEHIRLLLPKETLRKEEDWSTVLSHRERGQKLFDKIYERHSKLVAGNLNMYHPDLLQTAIHHLYAPTLSDESVLDGRETSLTLVASLTVQNVKHQLRGHKFGALHNGATKKELEKLEAFVLEIADYYTFTFASL